MKEKRSYATSIFVVMLLMLLLPSLYLGSYCAMVRRGSLVFEGAGVYDLPVEYRFGDGVTRLLFFPAHLLDRKVRPSYWKDIRPSIHVDYIDTGSSPALELWVKDNAFASDGTGNRLPIRTEMTPR